MNLKHQDQPSKKARVDEPEWTDSVGLNLRGATSTSELLQKQLHAVRSLLDVYTVRLRSSEQLEKS